MKAKISDVAKIAGVSPTTVSRVLNNRGYISKETRENVYKEKKYVEMLIRNQVDGVIAVTYNRGIFDSESQSLPVVAVDHYLSKDIPTVSSDNYSGGKQATELLISKGCKHIVHINGPLKLETPANLRRKAYENVMKKDGKQPITYEISNTFDRNIQRETISKVFEEHPEVD